MTAKSASADMLKSESLIQMDSICFTLSGYRSTECTLPDIFTLQLSLLITTYLLGIRH